MTVTMGDKMQEGRKPVSETHSKTVRPIQKITLPWLGIVNLIFINVLYMYHNTFQMDWVVKKFNSMSQIFLSHLIILLPKCHYLPGQLY